jgi:Icc protein
MKIIAQITDLHIDNDVDDLKHIDPRANMLAVLDAIQEQGISEIIASGDIAESREGTDWFFEQMHLRGLKYHIILGNHDLPELFTEKKVFSDSKPYYALEFEGQPVIFMDSASYRVDQEQLAWLEQQLSRLNQDVILFIHHPVLDCGGTWMDKRFPLQNRDEVVAALTKTKHKIALFCGHYHSEAIVVHENITQYVTPSTFYQLKKFSEIPAIEGDTFGYRVLTLENGNFQTEVKYLAH